MSKNTDYLRQPIFTHQVLSLIDEPLINKACKQHQSNKYSKSLSFKDHLVMMLYGVFERCTSLREVQTGLELCNGKLNHLNLTKVPPQSTLSDGNKNKDSKVFETLYWRSATASNLCRAKSPIAFSILSHIVSIHLMNYTSLIAISNRYKQKRERKPKDKPQNKPMKNSTPAFSNSTLVLSTISIVKNKLLKIDLWINAQAATANAKKY